MIESHNRHMSFSLYICVLAVTDTISLIIGEYTGYIYVMQQEDRRRPPATPTTKIRLW